MAIIAEKLGVTSPALLKRFGTKEELLCEALAPAEAPPFLATIEEGPTDAPLEDQMLTLAREIAAWLRSMTPRFAALQASGIVYQMIRKKFTIPPPVRTLNALTAWFERAAQRSLVTPGDASTMASIMLGTLHIRIFLSFLSAHSSPATENLDPYLTTAMRMLARSFSGEAHL